MKLDDDILSLKGFPVRLNDAHKRTVGTVAIVGGSLHFPHAPVIAALGARSAGAGLIHLVAPNVSSIAAGVHVPEATITKLTSTCAFPRADVTVTGMGLGLSPTSEVIVSKLISGSSSCFVLDADALGILAKWYAAKNKYHPQEGQTMVLTPHEGEAAKLLAVTPEEVSLNRKSAAISLADRYKAVVVLKGAGTLVAVPFVGSDGAEIVYECKCGNPFLALGGMGDLLSGMIAARWAYLKNMASSLSAIECASLAAASAVWLHAKTADDLISAEPPVAPTVKSVSDLAASMRISLELKKN